jgi:uncharacterized protein
MSGWLQVMAGAAFMTGLAGGAHCAAMCSGIIAACTTRRAQSAAKPQRWQLPLAYNVGRIASYTAAGIGAGALGQTALFVRGGDAAQTIMMIAAGLSMLTLALYVAGFAPFVTRIEKVGSFAWRLVQPYSRHFLPADTVLKALGLGAVWGWLPCAMVYGVLLIAVASADALQGGVVMLAFGAGTLPNALALSLVAARLRGFTRKPALRVGVAAVIAAIGLFALVVAAHPHAIASDGFLCQIVPLPRQSN